MNNRYYVLEMLSRNKIPFSVRLLPEESCLLASITPPPHRQDSSGYEGRFSNYSDAMLWLANKAMFLYPQSAFANWYILPPQKSPTYSVLRKVGRFMRGLYVEVVGMRPSKPLSRAKREERRA